VVYALCLRIVKDVGTAEEVTIDVFHEVWARAERYSAGRGAPVAYLVTLARSRALDRMRARGKAVRGEGSSLTCAAVDPAAGSVAAAVAEERRLFVRRALELLDPKYREVLECSYFEGLSHSEIALKLAKPVGTVKTYLRRGLIQLRDFLRNPDEGARYEGRAPQKQRGIDQVYGANAASAGPEAGSDG
jgi:RNA polymerase sigma-70 factor (ECF subfamily)